MRPGARPRIFRSETTMTAAEDNPFNSSLTKASVRLSAPGDAKLPTHAFTVDVEDWYQSCIDYDAPISDRVVRNVDNLLALLDESGVKGSFFVQGKVAEAFPGVVRSLVDQGHEVQSHGYSHRPLFQMSRPELREELKRAKETVEDAAGQQVTAFRAQDFSIRADNLWALEMLAEIGFWTDSSIFPMRSRHYGIAKWEVDPHYLVFDGNRILEVPVAIWTHRRFRIPVAGGGYFRFLPRLILERGLSAIEKSGRPAIVYFHPYEFSVNELDSYPDVSRLTRLSQGAGRGALAGRIRSMLTKFKFGRMDDVLKAWGVQ